MANTPSSQRNGAVGFIDWLGLQGSSSPDVPVEYNHNNNEPRYAHEDEACTRLGNQREYKRVLVPGQTRLYQAMRKEVAEAHKRAREKERRDAPQTPEGCTDGDHSYKAKREQTTLGDGLHGSNENKMSDGGRGRASLGMGMRKSS